MRQSEGLSVAIVDVEDVFDEFSFGVKTPQAIKDFLGFARSSWQKAPRFLLLVGDANATDPVCVLSPHKQRILSLLPTVRPEAEPAYRS